MNDKPLSKRLLAYSFAASVLINLGWVAWVAHSDIFGSAATITTLREKPIKVFKPIPQKLQPKPKEPPKPPPPPPKPSKHPPKIRPIKPIKPLPPPKVTPPKPLPPRPLPPRPQPARPQPPQPQAAPVRTIAVVRTNNPQAKHQVALPAVPNMPPLTQPFVPSQTPVQPQPEQPKPVVEQPKPPPVVEQPKPLLVQQPKAPPVVEQPKPPPVVHHPDKWVPIDQQEASFPDNIGDNVQKDDITRESITNSKVVISFTIDETGHARKVRIKESCGNSELDNRFADAVRRTHGKPAIQDHIPRDQPYELPFDVG